MKRQAGVCKYCLRICKRGSGLQVHLRSCKKRYKAQWFRHQPRTTDNDHVDVPLSPSPFDVPSPVSPETSDTGLGKDDYISSSESEFVEEDEDSSAAVDYLGILDSTTDNSAPMSLSAAFLRETTASNNSAEREEDEESSQSATSIPFSRGRLSTASSENIIQGYEQATGIPAGAQKRKNTAQPHTNWGDRLGSFVSDVDFGFAQWLHNENISKNAITRLLRDRRLDPLTSLLSWQSADQLRDKIDSLNTHGHVGDWHSDTFTVDAAHAVTGEASYTLRYRKVDNALRFFLSHPGFRDDLDFAPYRAWTGEDGSRRLYTEMASADWWWETQEKIGVPGATIIPLIISSDKTQVTNHQGDLAAHAVYLTIGNLKANVRHSNERPGSILLALLPIVKDGDLSFRSRIFHDSLRRIFDAVIPMAEEGIDVECSDGWTRRCFPIIAAITTDYEEQVKLTGVKANQHCTMCKISPANREDLEAWAPWRTHEDTQRQIMLQRHASRGDSSSNQDEQVHDIDCFAFGHRWSNIYRSMMVDLLHQLLKGVLMHVLGWVQALLQERMPLRKGKLARAAVEAARRRGHRFRDGTVPKELVVAMVDKRFASIPIYRGLRIFKRLSAVKQWTGKEQKSILRQVMPVFTPLLQEVEATEAIRFMRAVVDFILLASYKSHDDDTLRYMDLALFRMNQHKEVFRRYRTSTESDNEGHFNFPKWHVMTHYPEMIRLYGSAPNMDTNHAEHNHVKFIKNAFKLTNKKPGWEDQIMEWNRRSVNMQARFDIAYDTRDLNTAELREATERPIQPTEPVDVQQFFNWPTSRRRYSKGRDVWRTVAEVADLLGQPLGTTFRQAAAVFVRESRLTSDEGLQAASTLDPDRLERDDDWVNGYYVQFHASLRCWRPTGEDPDNPDAVEQDMVRCAPNWQNIPGNQRNDWVWVQEYHMPPSPTEDQHMPDLAFDGRLPARVRYILSIEDPVYVDQLDPKHRARYTGAFVDLFAPKDSQGLADEVHGMTVIKPVPPNPSRRTRKLGGQRIYALTSLYYAIHVVPIHETGNSPTGEMYINNTADWDTYNMLWNSSWEEDAARAAIKSRDAKRAATTLI